VAKCVMETEIMSGTMDRGAAPGYGGAGGGRKKESTMLLELQLSPDRPAATFQVQSITDEGSTGRHKYTGFHGNSVRTSGVADDGVGGSTRRSGPTTAANGDDAEFGELNLVADIHGRLAGSAQMDGSIFQFETSDDGSSVISTEIKVSDLPPDEPVDIVAGDLDKHSNSDSTRLLRGAGVDAHARTLQKQVGGTDTGVEYIDILVPYTLRTLCVMNDASSDTDCTPTAKRRQKVENRIALAIEEVNGALLASGIVGRVRLAQAFLVTDTPLRWDEQSLTYQQVLVASTTKGDGLMEEIHSKRNEYGADVVILWVDHPASCGLAYSGRPVAAQWAFAVVNWKCATGYYSFAHEFAHLLGALHDRVVQSCPVVGCCDIKYGCDNYGYMDVEYRYRSILSYDCPTTGGCPRVQMFSTPHHNLFVAEVRTYPMGEEELTDNASQIQASWSEVSSYRDPPTQDQQHSNTNSEQEQELAPVSVTAPVSAPGPANSCGDGICRRKDDEDCHTCPQDCPSGVFEGHVCGNGICEIGEHCNNCPEDCSSRSNSRSPTLDFCCVGGPEHLSDNVAHGVHCMDRMCQFGVECNPERPATTEFCCGDNVCSPGEGVWRDSCPTDCHCEDNGVCDWWEDGRCVDCQHDNSHTGAICMENGRACGSISPNPCCGVCGEEDNVCHAVAQ
jgi:hypothetical protein